MTDKMTKEMINKELLKAKPNFSGDDLNDLINLDKAYWNKETRIDEKFRKMLNNERFLE